MAAWTGRPRPVPTVAANYVRATAFDRFLSTAWLSKPIMSNFSDCLGYLGGIGRLQTGNGESLQLKYKDSINFFAALYSVAPFSFCFRKKRAHVSSLTQSPETTVFPPELDSFTPVGISIVMHSAAVGECISTGEPVSRLPPSKWLWPKSPPVVPHRPSTGDRLKPTFGAKNAAAAFNSTFQQCSLLREGFLLICFQPRGSRILLFDCLLRYRTDLIYFPKLLFNTYICSYMIIAIYLHWQLFSYIPPHLNFSIL